MEQDDGFGVLVGGAAEVVDAPHPVGGSRYLGAGLRGLTGQWAAEHGYRPLLAEPQVQQAGALVTVDPLHHKEATARVILDKGGDHRSGPKENTSQRLAAATQTLAGTAF